MTATIKPNKTLKNKEPMIILLLFSSFTFLAERWTVKALPMPFKPITAEMAIIL
jgi:hypothetical protein